LSGICHNFESVPAQTLALTSAIIIGKTTVYTVHKIPAKLLAKVIDKFLLPWTPTDKTSNQPANLTTYHA
jgi:hypothetical protein